MTKTKSKLPARLTPLEDYCLPDGYVWLVMVPFGWAKGDDLGSTVRKACRNGGKRGVRPYSPSRGWLNVFASPSTVVVDGFGRVVDDPKEGYGCGRTQLVAHWDEDSVCQHMLPEHLYKAIREQEAAR